MDDVVIARALHIIGVILWIGGVGFVTTVLLPALRRIDEPTRRIALFEQLENRFAWQARATTLLVGASGFHMVSAWDLWARFSSIHFWWMHAMVFLWLVFTVMLFIAEPVFLHAWFKRRAASRPDSTFLLIERLHRGLLIASILTVAGATAGSHGTAF